MKHVFFALLGLALSVPALSQSSDSKIKAYLRGGVNYNLNGVGLDSGFTNAGSIARLERPVNRMARGAHRARTAQRRQLPRVRNRFIPHAPTPFRAPTSTGTRLTKPCSHQSVQLALSPGFRLFKLVRAQAGINALFELNDDFKSTFANYQLGLPLGRWPRFGQKPYP